MSLFIPKPYRKEPFTMRMDTDKLLQIDRLATQFNLSRNLFMNQCIDFALEHMEVFQRKDAKLSTLSGRGRE